MVRLRASFLPCSAAATFHEVHRLIALPDGEAGQVVLRKLWGRKAVRECRTGGLRVRANKGQ